jgi:putative FmdB family regulatory protein
VQSPPFPAGGSGARVKPSPEGQRRIEMPTYEYECKDCKKKFSVILSISEHGKTKVACPKCKGKKVKQGISLFTTKTSRKS